VAQRLQTNATLAAFEEADLFAPRHWRCA
jgi:hypothetical protein